MSSIASVVQAVAGLTNEQKQMLIEGISATIDRPETKNDSVALSVPLRTPMEAAAANPVLIPLLRQVKAQAARLGYSLKDNAPVDVAELNEAIKGKDITDRMRLRESLYLLGLIPR